MKNYGPTQNAGETRLYGNPLGERLATVEARAAIVAGAEPSPPVAPVDIPTFWDIAEAAAP